MKQRTHTNRDGFLFIEAVVTIAVVTIVVASILTLYNFTFNSESREDAKLTGSLYAQESLEAIDFIARYDWTQMRDGIWHPAQNGALWELKSDSELLDGRFTRTITIAEVRRANTSNSHAYGDIVASGGFVDPETKLVTATVTWNQAIFGTQRVEYQMYQARDESKLFSQRNWNGGPGQQVFTDVSQFAAGVNVDYSASGVLALAANYITWDNATTTAEYDLPSNIDAEAIFVKGNILFIGTANNGGSGPGKSELYVFDISNLANPVLLSEIEVGDNINAIYADGNYAALATGVDSGELRIFNISNPSNVTFVTSRDLPANDDASDITAYQNYLYIIQGSSFFTFSYSDPANPQQTDVLNLGGAVLNAVSVLGGKAFVSSNIDSKEFIVLDVIDPTNAREIAFYDLPGNRQAIDVYAFGFYAYVATSNSGSEPEFYMFNITNPFSPQLTATFEIGENLYTVSALSNFAFLGSGRVGKDILVLDITNPSNIFVETGYEVKGTATDIFPTPEAIYLATNSNDGELVIISVNSNVDLYAASGFAESSTFDTQSETSTYNWLSWVGTKPESTQVKFQIATNNDGTNWNYLGPDGTANTYYTSLSRGLLHYAAHLNQRYVRYKVILESTNKAQTPYVNRIEISYSP